MSGVPEIAAAGGLRHSLPQPWRKSGRLGGCPKKRFAFRRGRFCRGAASPPIVGRAFFNQQNFKFAAGPGIRASARTRDHAVLGLRGTSMHLIAARILRRANARSQSIHALIPGRDLARRDVPPRTGGKFEILLVEESATQRLVGECCAPAKAPASERKSFFPGSHPTARISATVVEVNGGRPPAAAIFRHAGHSAANWTGWAKYRCRPTSRRTHPGEMAEDQEALSNCFRPHRRFGRCANRRFAFHTVIAG